jgi:hypothetical protein
MDRVDIISSKEDLDIKPLTMKFPGKNIHMNYGTFLHKTKQMMLTLQDRKSGKIFSYPLK